MIRRLRTRDDAGLSLVELLVTMMLTGVVMALVGTAFFSSLRTTAQVNAKVVQTTDTRQALEVMTRRLRVAVPPTPTGSAFASATATSVRFYSALQSGSTVDPKPTQVEYTIDATRKCLLETLTTASGSSAPYTFPATNAKSTCLAFGTISSTTRLFSYYDDGASMTAMGSAAGTVAAADLQDVESVKIDLMVTAGTRARGTNATSRVTLPNIGIFVNGASS